MKKFHLLAMFLLSVVKLTAQSYDSLIIQLNNHEYQKVLDRIDQSELNSELLYYQSLAYKGVYQYSYAIQSVEQSLRSDSTSERAKFLLADLYSISGQVTGSINCYKSILECDSANLQATTKLANLYFQQQDYFSAMQHYMNMAYADRDNWYALRQLGICNEKLHSPVFIPITYYLEALALNPRDQVSVSRLSRIYHKEGEYRKSVDLTNQFLELDSSNTSILRLNGYAYLHDKNSDSAIVQLKKCLALEDSSFFVFKFLGYSYFDKRDYGQSIQYLEKAYQIDSTDVHTCFFLGASCGRLYYKQKGVDYLRHTIKLLEPDKKFVAKVYVEMAATYQSFSKYDEASIAYTEALEAYPGKRDIMLELGCNYDYYIKNYDQALKYYAMYLDSTDANPDTLTPLYYNRLRAERRIKNIKEEKFWRGKLSEEEIKEKIKEGGTLIINNN